jgi:hypothetical protein
MEASALTQCKLMVTHVLVSQDSQASVANTLSITVLLNHAQMEEPVQTLKLHLDVIADQDLQD